MEPQYVAIALAGGLLIYYYFRTRRLQQLKLIQRAQPVAQQEKYSSKFPFVSAKDRISYPGDWVINAPGYVRDGQFGLERRDYADVGGTRVVTYGDAWVNV